MVNAIRARQDPHGRSHDALLQTRFIESQLAPAAP
jgi:hypothetical protein